MDTLNGYIESIVFRNNDNGYVVCKIRSDNKVVSAVGVVPLIKEGQKVKLQGYWSIHKQFGEQFTIQEYEEVVPDTADGIEEYLSSGIIKGIGPVTAKKIIQKFGDKTFDILENNIDKLKEIEGIGKKKYEVIYESYTEQQGLRNIIMYFNKYGITNGQCMKIYKKFGNDAKQTILENPYILCEEIKGIGFKTADRIAVNIGIDASSEFRVKSAIKYILNKFCLMGNTYMPKQNLIDECSETINIPKEFVKNNIDIMSEKKEIILEEIDGVEAVFLLPYYYCELGVTRKIVTLSIQDIQTLNDDIDFEIKMFEKQQKMKFADSQKDAIKGAFTNGIEIITGGPGTGKTTIIKAIINIYENNGMKVILGAPTGRAAKRMTESTGRESKTLHRLLEMGVDSEEGTVFEKDESSPLDCDVIIIDEASMIDILLMHNLLKAIKLGTRLIIVGDVDQLPSVAPGNVLKDLIESQYIKVIRLKEIFRQGNESLIVTNAHKINQGEMPILNQRDKDFFFLNQENTEKMLDTIIDLMKRRLPKFNSKWDVLRDIQVLSPMRKGILGVTNLNERLQEVFNKEDKSKNQVSHHGSIFREGDKVMQIKNNYSIKWTQVDGDDNSSSGIFNGDLGFIERIDNQNKFMTILFDDDKRVKYDFTFLDELDLAYATTIHKSQGSEFKVVILPVFMGSPFLMNRNLLYTGITRAKELVVTVGTKKALTYMIENTKCMERYSALKYRICEIVNVDEG